MNKVMTFIKAHTVFAVSFFFALISSFFNHPSKSYISYIDFNTIWILFSLMAVVQSLEKCGAFNSFASLILSKVHSLRALCAVLVYLCFFWSMLITNDVALITFVPFAILLLNKKDIPQWVLCYVVVLQTIAANTGSMLTPTGNPQNLFLYGQSGISLISFILKMLPLTSFCCFILFIMLFIIPHRKLSSSEGNNLAENKKSSYSKYLYLYKLLYTALFVLCILSVVRIIPKPVLALIILSVYLACDYRILLKVDYYLLFTFIFFFIFTGNLSSLSSVRGFLENIVSGNEYYVSFAVSQVISNVPATLMLFPFSTDLYQLLYGVNCGGLGTLVASLASLISYNIYVSETHKAFYFIKIFTLMNLVMICLIMIFKYFIGI